MNIKAKIMALVGKIQTAIATNPVKCVGIAIVVGFIIGAVAC